MNFLSQGLGDSPHSDYAPKHLSDWIEATCLLPLLPRPMILMTC